MKSIVLLLLFSLDILGRPCNSLTTLPRSLPFVAALLKAGSETKEPLADSLLIVRSCADFMVNGKGDNTQWTKATWNNLAKLDTGGANYESRFKILYSTTGIYVLFNGTDDKITSREYNDFDPIFNGDVFEVFLHPDPTTGVYFEYEVNQLNRQLILTLSRKNNQLFSWAPKYPAAAERQPIKKFVEVAGEKAAVGAAIKGWSAELFFPYTILGLLPAVPPQPGAIWHANFCRLDYDSGNMIKYSWSSTIKKSFHELDQFRSVRFE